MSDMCPHLLAGPGIKPHLVSCNHYGSIYHNFSFAFFSFCISFLRWGLTLTTGIKSQTTMVKLKGVGKTADPPRNPKAPLVSDELSHLEYEFQIHRDETSARLEELQASIQDSLATSLAQFKLAMMEELTHQLTSSLTTVVKDGLHTSQSLVVSQGSTAVPQPDGTVQFGSI
ncbi:hypothetical protein RchiOBHm_Chr1g0321691 [Rosa chinensis]|uniref:Uncharacterized protein n=1 Tax=Rosa chinensis TaxID=74649 RepID=A0A2P6S923_ROSCH|nr:hypothetical protein RchiOBHm_Chr1g0321691 [Rosa chinensis]